MKRKTLITCFGFIICLLFFFLLMVKGIYNKQPNEDSDVTIVLSGQPTTALHVTSQPVEQEEVLQEHGDYKERQLAEETNTRQELEELVPEQSEGDSESILTCTLSVSCESALNNLPESKRMCIPQDGIIFKEQVVEFYEEESVFDVLYREMRNHKIPFEFVNTPMYNSAYIEGIHNLYEFDCGAYSGWTYRVNGIKPNVGCSQYKVNEGDEIEIFFTCNFLEEKE